MPLVCRGVVRHQREDPPELHFRRGQLPLFPNAVANAMCASAEASLEAFAQIRNRANRVGDDGM
jgi:hypothetical protein